MCISLETNKYLINVVVSTDPMKDILIVLNVAAQLEQTTLFFVEMYFAPPVWVFFLTSGYHH